ncbi:MAG: M20 family metallo-hydrolase [Myxococcota bacterium]|nr:M20 family metallo-hydrolase [Myxococcota bacterium]
MDLAAFDRVCRRLESYPERMIELQSELVKRVALGPTSGGEGEAEKAAFLENYLRTRGITDIEDVRAPDPRVPCGYRPNLIVRIPGEDHSLTVWFMAHLDVVPAGDLESWHSDPFELTVDGDKLIGRGVEDNHQGLVASVMAVLALAEEGITPACDVGLLLVADEETGSKFGVAHVLSEADQLRPNDLVVVPDGGEPDGSLIEVAEKSIAWMKFVVTGQTAHGSTPERGRNATRAAAHLTVALDELHEHFSAQDPLFDPPGSTFAPTKREANVDNINTIPDRDVFYWDCRILPRYELEEVEAFVKEKADAVAKRFGVQIEISYPQREKAALPTSADAPVVRALRDAVKAVYGVEARPGGIGGGTVAAFLRRAGIPAAVWARMEETMHGPDEFCLLSNLVGDAKVFAHLMLKES